MFSNYMDTYISLDHKFLRSYTPSPPPPPPPKCKIKSPTYILTLKSGLTILVNQTAAKCNL